MEIFMALKKWLAERGSEPSTKVGGGVGLLILNQLAEKGGWETLQGVLGSAAGTSPWVLCASAGLLAWGMISKERSK